MTADSLAGRVAVVTGASRGLGRRIAEALAREGVNVALLARDADALDTASRSIGPLAAGFRCDVADPASVRAAMAEAAARFGRLDILVNNAAVTEIHRIDEATDESLQQEVGINLLGPMYCVREAVPHLRAAGGGDIVNVTSEAVRAPFPYLTTYAATKAGLETFTAGLRLELAEYGIRATVLRAGHMGESRISAHWSPQARAAFDETMRKTGMISFTGAGFSPAIAADALVSLLKLPRDVNVDLIEIRSAARPH